MYVDPVQLSVTGALQLNCYSVDYGGFHHGLTPKKRVEHFGFFIAISSQCIVILSYSQQVVVVNGVAYKNRLFHCLHPNTTIFLKELILFLLITLL